MGDPEPSNRRDQIVDATLELLADTPLDQLSTRRIAERVGLSQPALFRHFRSREQIILAVIARARGKLGVIAEAVLGELDDPLEQLQELARRIAGLVERNPGLPRLLFLLPEPGEVHTALRGLLSMLMALVAELVRDGQRRGTFSASVAPAHAATLFVGMLQGIALRARLGARDTGLEDDARALMALWLHGTCATDADGPGVATASGVEPTQDGIVALDVRPILDGGLDPLADVLGALAALAPGAVLAITAPFRPGPLLVLLKRQGHGVSVREAQPDLWTVDVVVDDETEIIDLTDLEPPEPLERVLLAATSLGPGQVYLARLPRFPQLLLAQLHERQQPCEVHQNVDGTTLIRLRRDAG